MQIQIQNDMFLNSKHQVREQSHCDNSKRMTIIVIEIFTIAKQSRMLKWWAPLRRARCGNQNRYIIYLILSSFKKVMKF